MSAIGNTTKRTLIGLLALLQILFYPALTYPITASAEDDNEAYQTQLRAEYDAQREQLRNDTRGVTEATPQTNSEAAPATTQSTTASPDAGSLNAIDSGTNAQSDTTIGNSADVNNNIDSSAQTGDARVIENRVAENATTGDAVAIENLINMLNSQSNVLGAEDMVTFTANINGSVVGDLFIDPGAMNSIQNSLDAESNVQVTNQGSINNIVDLNALSGNATVAGNRVGGNATTGDANAVANIVNVLNSIISAGKSFFGTININGNLNGDILFPPNVLESVLASNSIPTATIDIPIDVQNNANLSNSQSINNDVTTTAQSGNASVADNRVAGDATTGNATTKITVLNLTSNQVVGANTLLVFVNVHGQWVGLIMDAPGSTAAALGGGIVQNSVNLENSVDASNTGKINNVVNVNAESGDASVNENRVAGNATTGNASASANIVNMANSQFSLSGWFGILFINVFGSWFGSFGVDTAAGNLPAQNTGGAPQIASKPPQVFKFIPSGTGSNHLPTYRLSAMTYEGASTDQAGYLEASSAGAESEDDSKALGVSTASDDPLYPSAADPADAGSFWSLPITILIFGLALLGIQRALSIYQHRRN